MKTVTFKFLTVVLIGFIGVFSITSCEEESDKAKGGEQLDINGEIVGKWKHYRITDNEGTHNHVSECLSTHGEDYIEFKTDGTVYNQIYSKDNNGNCIFNGDMEGTWEKTGSVLKISLSPDENGENADGGEYQILILNDTTLKVQGHYEDDEGVVIEYTQELKRL